MHCLFLFVSVLFCRTYCCPPFWVGVSDGLPPTSTIYHTGVCGLGCCLCLLPGLNTKVAILSPGIAFSGSPVTYLGAAGNIARCHWRSCTWWRGSTHYLFTPCFGYFNRSRGQEVSAVPGLRVLPGRWVRVRLGSTENRRIIE